MSPREGSRRLALSELAIPLLRMLLRRVWVPAVEPFVSIPRLWRWLDAPASVRARQRRPAPEELENLLRLAHRVLAVPPRPRARCLRRCQVLFPELRRLGVPAAVCLGVREDGSGVAGHSWIELDGDPWGEREDPRLRFRTMYRYPEAGRAESARSSGSQLSHGSEISPLGPAHQ